MGILLLIVILVVNSVSSGEKEKAKVSPPTLDKQLGHTQEIEKEEPKKEEELPKYCPECGSPLTGEFCEFCGAKIKMHHA